MPVQARLQLLNHLAFKDSLLMGKFGCAEYAPTKVLLLLLLLLLLLFNFKIIQPIDFRAFQKCPSVLHCSYGRCDYCDSCSQFLWSQKICGLTWIYGRLIYFYDYHLAENCSNSLGMNTRNKIIPNESITASSSLNSNRAPSYARLDGPKAWCSAPADNSSYIQILLKEETLITAIETQGSRLDYIWARKYDVWYLKRGKWILHREVL